MRVLARRGVAVAVTWMVVAAAPAHAGGDALELAFEEAKKINRQALSYSYGGGHVAGKVPGPKEAGGYDCSGAVSRVLWKAGLIDEVQTSSSFSSWGKPGGGPLSVHVNSGHVFLELRGPTTGRRYYFGTSYENPGGGPGFFRPDESYLAGFEERRPTVRNLGR